MIRERCSCGAEFETDVDQAVRLVKDWRANHRHDLTLEQRDSSIISSIDTQRPDPREPELHIGFRPEEDI